MKLYKRPAFGYSLIIALFLLTSSCSDDAPASPTTSVTTSSGAGATGGDSTNSVGGTGGEGGSSVGGQGGRGGAGGAGGQGGSPFNCVSARETALGPVDEVSVGDVTVLNDSGGVRELYIDASAGGFMMASMNPAIYVDLESATRVDIDDFAAFDAPNWDLALKRVMLRNNSAHGGGGDGASAFLAGADFATVSMADAAGATLEDETWFDMDCNYEADETGALETTMSPDWYEYDPNTFSVAPKAGVFILRGGDGTTFFKVQIVDYYANPDGSTGATSGRYVLRIATL